MQRYERLYGWALQLTGRDRQRAEDLLHDAFIQFSLSLTDLEAIQNVDAYLYGMLRNIYLAQTRRTIRLQNRLLSVVEYDSAEIGLRAIDPRHQIQLQDELRQICHYACVRKETSKAGSVLVLRFFHGYYPAEIAQVLHTTRHAVEDWLRIARREVKLYLSDAGCLKFMKGAAAVEIPPTGFAREVEDFLRELRSNIFGARRGDCMTGDVLTTFYQSTNLQSINSTTLGHIVSCPNCLDVVNGLLNLPLLSERSPTDTIGPETRGGKGGSNKPGGGDTPGGGGIAAMREAVKRHRREARKVFEHRPKELCITVNGFPLGSQRIGLEMNELTLNIKGEEKIEFVEVVSEQEIRLLLLSVNEPPPSGLYEQSEQVALSDGRMLEARLSFSNPWPTLQVVYCDPTLRAEPSASFVDFDESAPLVASLDEREDSSRPATNGTQRHFASQLWHRLSAWRFWLRPASITAVFAILLIAAMLTLRLRAPLTRVSPVDLLQRSTANEQAHALAKDYVTHRTITLEERRDVSGEVVARRRVEVWHSAEKGLTARRLYGEQNRLIAGEWMTADGSRTLYQHGTQSRLTPQQHPATLKGIDDVWLLGLSAQDFSRIVVHADQAQVEETPDAYVINYQSTTDAEQGWLLQAVLVLNKADLHAVEQTLTVRQGDALRQYRFIETSLQQHPKDQVAADAFEPETELFKAVTERMDTKSKAAVVVEEPSAAGALKPPAATPVTASPELEVEVTSLLDRIKANMGEQVEVKRTAAGTLRVQAITETEQRKTEILQALASLAGNPAVEVRVETIAEALKRQKELPSSAAIVSEIEVAKNPFPAYTEVTRYFSEVKGMSDEQSDAAARRFAGGILGRARQAMSHAWALQQLARRFSTKELEQLNPEARGKWFSMMRAHAQAFQKETAGLRQELEPVFFRSMGGGDLRNETEPGSVADLSRAAAQLFELGATQERALRFAFTTSNKAATPSAVNSRQLWQSLRSAEKLSERIQNGLPK